MSNLKHINLNQFEKTYHVSTSFIEVLNDYQLVELVVIDNKKHIQIKEIKNIEKLIRLHYDLNINFEGLDVICNLTNQIENLQQEIITLKNKLNFYTQ